MKITTPTTPAVLDVPTDARGARSPRGSRALAQLVGLVVGVLAVGDRTGSRDERGLSQSTENAVLLVGAVAVATIVIAAVKAYVGRNMPQ